MVRLIPDGCYPENRIKPRAAILKKR